MSLGLLVPLFLVGLAGVAIPVIVHLTRRQRRNVVRFPSLMFLGRIPFREQRRHRIRHWLLLLMRALALAVIVVAFTRPFLEGEGVGEGFGGGPREVVVLLDRSYSMEAAGGFAEAIEAARRVFDGLGPSDRASLVTFGRGAEVVARSTADRVELERALATAFVGASSTRYGPALRLAATIVEESRLPVGEIYLVSDFQRVGWDAADAATVPRSVALIPVAVGLAAGHGGKDVATSDAEDLANDRGDGMGQGPHDLSVTEVALARSPEGQRERLTVTARIARFGGAVSVSVPVALFIDGREVERVEAFLPVNGAAQVGFAPFTLSLPQTRGEVRLMSESALASNDARRFVASPGGALSILLIEGTGAMRDASLFLRQALAISEGGRFAVNFRRANAVSDGDLQEVHTVVVNDVRLGDRSLGRLRAFVEAGGGVIVALGPGGGQSRATGEQLLPGQVGGVRDRDPSRGGRIGLLAYSHPVFAAFAGPRSGDFTGARFLRSRDLVVSDSAEVLARFDDGSPLLAERRIGRGTVLVWASSLDTYWNDLALQPVFLPFVHRMVEYGSGRAEAVEAFTVGQVIDLGDPAALEAAGADAEIAASTAEATDLVALTPDGGSVAVPDPGAPRYLRLDDAGFYTVRVRGTDPARPFTIGVNVEIAESDLTGMDPEELVARSVGSATATDSTSAEAAFELAPPGESRDSPAEMLRADRERRQSLWRWLLLSAFALLAGETLLSNRIRGVARAG